MSKTPEVLDVQIMQAKSLYESLLAEKEGLLNSTPQVSSIALSELEDILIALIMSKVFGKATLAALTKRQIDIICESLNSMKERIAKECTLSMRFGQPHVTFVDSTVAQMMGISEQLSWLAIPK